MANGPRPSAFNYVFDRYAAMQAANMYDRWQMARSVVGISNPVNIVMVSYDNLP